MSNPRWLNGRAKAGPIRNFGRRAYLNAMSKRAIFASRRAELRFRERRVRVGIQVCMQINNTTL